MENWKAIKNFETYEVSDLGRIRRVTSITCTKSGKILKLKLDKGYLRVCLCRGGKKHYKAIHRLVAQAFVPNPKGLPQVNHTGKKTNNRACKLEWVTTKEHGRDRTKRGQSNGDGVRFHKAKKSKKWEACYCPEPRVRKSLGYFNTFKEAKIARDAAIKTL